jgi:HD-GYP domain-containing protein (c-di-GMP phosphodiesterase class II)
MKVLFLSNTPETDDPIKKLMMANFPRVKLIEANNAEALMELMTNDGPFNFVIVCIDNKVTEVRVVYESINDTLGVRPFIFIGTSASMKAYITTEILQNPATNFLVETPIAPEELKKAVMSCIEWVKQEEFEESILEFTKDDLHKMRMRNFYLFEQMPYDVYLELTPTQFGKVITKNKPFSHQLIQNFSRKNIKFLYLRKDDHLKFLDISIKNLIKIYEAKMTERKKYATLHLKTIFFIHQFIKTLSVSDDVVKLTNMFIDSAREAVKAYDNIGDLITTITESSSMTFAEHSLATAYTCESILYNMGWNADMSRDKLLLAAILQDITLNNDDMIKIRSLNDPNFKMLSEEDQEDFKNHPTKSAQIATFFSGFSDVDFILAEQHEHPTGDGFPKGLNSSGLTTISCIFILASNFVSRLSQTTGTPNSYKDIIGSMKRVYHTGNFKDPLKALEKAFKK